ncbi:MAG: DUF2299 domain-containing protein [Candidatus Lokiarchaeota archaeon]|nr:DUF2299 domain-containing protein [Candidatus Lokiarchaeota archaeon]MBD3198504.1 DUF2299 domain-containing protein [Candidatus Lokiarchaeota archaeon]
MSENKNNLEDIIREYLLDEGLLRKRITDSKLSFGFQFVYPPVPETVKARTQAMVVFQPKKKDLLIISIGTQISPPHVEALEKLGEAKIKFFMELKKLFHLKNLFFRIDIANYRYEISDQIFLNSNELISKNTFFDSITKIFNVQAYSNILLMEFCSDKLNINDLKNNKDFDSSAGFSLYT